jgi:hypothetical protein
LLAAVGRDVARERDLRDVLDLDHAGLVWARDRRVDFIVGIDDHRVPVELKILSSASSRSTVMALILQGVAWWAALGRALLVVIDTSDAGVTPTPEESGFLHWLEELGVVLLWCRRGTAVRIGHVTSPGPWRVHKEDREREHLADLLAGAVSRSGSSVESTHDLLELLREHASQLGDVAPKKIGKQRLFGFGPATSTLSLHSRSGRRFAIGGQVIVPKSDDADSLLQGAIASAHLRDLFDGNVVVCLNRKAPKNAAHMEQSHLLDLRSRLARFHADMGIDWRLVSAGKPDEVIRLPGLLPLARDIPKPKDRQGRLDEFAQTFFGYGFWLEQASEASAGRSARIRDEVREQFESTGGVGESIVRVRTALFFEQRSARHVGYVLTERDPFVRALVEALRGSTRIPRS